MLKVFVSFSAMKKTKQQKKKDADSASSLEVVKFLRKEGVDKLRSRFNVVVKKHSKVPKDKNNVLDFYLFSF